jgi:hypothetical protein
VGPFSVFVNPKKNQQESSQKDHSENVNNISCLIIFFRSMPLASWPFLSGFCQEEEKLSKVSAGNPLRDGA